MQVCQRDIGADWKSSQQAKVENMSKKVSKFNYNPKYKTDIRESMLIEK